MIDWTKVIVAGLGLLASLAIGFAGGNVSDLAGARSWQQSKAEELLELDRLRTTNTSLRAQTSLCLHLLDGAKLAGGGVTDVPVHGETLAVPPSAMELAR